MGTQGEIATKPKPAEEKSTKRKRDKGKLLRKKHKIPLVYYRRRTQNHSWKKDHPQFSK